MKILVTGAKGFVGRNLCAALREIRAGHDRRPDHILCADPAELQIYEYGRDSDPAALADWCSDCDFVIHLAGVNRPKDPAEFMEGNVDFLSLVLEELKRQGNPCPVLLTSSVQAAPEGRCAGSEYGKSKRAGEELLFAYGKETGAKVLVYRLPNLFGKWCRPNYNSVVATFCHNIANGLPIRVNDPAVELDLVYIDDLVEEVFRALRGEAVPGEDGFCTVPVFHHASLGRIAEIIGSFGALRRGLEVPNLGDPLTGKLYATYLTYLPQEQFAYDLQMNCDDRGSFTEILRTPDRGQFSVNISRPGITKGNHWHHSKNEKFVVVSGHGLIRMRQPGSDSMVEFEVSGERLRVVEMIPGWAHSIINLSDTEDLVTFMWANEPFDPAKPDTFFEKV